MTVVFLVCVSCEKRKCGNMKKKLEHFRNRHLLLADILLIVLAFAVSTFLIFPAKTFSLYFTEWIPNLLLTELVYLISLGIARVYHVAWLHAASKDYIRIISGAVLGGVVSCLLCAFLLQDYAYPKFLIFVNIMIIIMILSIRFGARFIFHANPIHEGKEKRVLVIGAGRLAVMLLRDLHDEKRMHYNVVGLIDDDKYKKNQIICGAQVLGTRDDILHICKKYKVEEIIFAIYEIDTKQKNEILDICTQTGCRLKIMSGMHAVLTGDIGVKNVRNIRIDDLLEREPIQLKNKLIAEDIGGKTVLVTGGGGSIGSELCRQISKYKPKKLLILDVYENVAYDLQNELRDMFPQLNMSVLIASVRDKQRLDNIFATYKPHIVFHAAAHKHVPLMEDSPSEAVKNNVFGTWNVAQCADQFGVEKFVMISTDKAVNPTNVMGATKRVCEMIVQTLAKTSKTEFVAVRFGNVLGSNGSVIPLFQKQIEKGGPVTVTHPEIIRYFMTIPEAANLVLQAASFAKGGEIFVLDMGEPVKIYDLAKKMILLAGFEPEKEIPITFTGLRPGEKLYEELLMSEEGLKNTQHSKIFIGKPMEISEEELAEKLERLRGAIESQSGDEVKRALTETVPTYRITNNS